MHDNALGLTGYLGLFWQADVVVKSIMIGLLLSSVLSWAIIVERTASLHWAARTDWRFIQRYRQSNPPAGSRSTAARLLSEMSREAGENRWNSLVRDCVEGRLRLILSEVQRQRRSGLTYLATLASSGPFIGLFSTVWGIMSVWASREHFEAWTRSEEFRKAHARAGHKSERLFMGHPQFEGFEAVQTISASGKAAA